MSIATAPPQLPSKRATVETVRDYLLSNRKQVELALPKHLNPDRFLRTAFTVFSQNPLLYDCSTRSLLGALVQCAQLGLEPGVLGHVYLIPFKNRKKGTTEVTVIPGYKGLLELARRSGQISTITAACVYQGDTYQRTLGTDPKIVHIPADAPVATKRADGSWDRRPVIAVYAVARLKDGGVQFDAMNWSDIEWHRDRYSRAAGDGPWVTDTEAMALKTVLRRLAKLLPAAIELHQAVELDERAEAGVSQELTALVTGGDEPAALQASAAAPGRLDKLTQALTPAPAAAPEPTEARTEPPATEPEVEKEEADPDDEEAEEAPEETADRQADQDMGRSLTLSIVSTLRNKVPPAVWANALSRRQITEATLGVTDIAVLEDLVADLKAVVATTSGKRR